MRVFVSRCDHEPSVLAALADAGLEVDVYEGRGEAPRPVLLRRIRGASALLHCPVLGKVDEEVVQASGGSLRVVATYSAGYLMANP